MVVLARKLKIIFKPILSMKKISFLLLLLMIMSAFMLFPAEDIKYQISFNGMDRDFTHSGLRPPEFADFTIDIKHRNTTIKSLKLC